MMVRRYVVTGRDGQVVRSLLERAWGRQDVEIVALGRPDFDLAKPDMIASGLVAAKPDLIISAAAYTAVDQAEHDEAAAAVVNGVAPGCIGDAAARLGIPVVHLSTDYVFDGEKITPYKESDTVAPLGAYGRSKLDGELALATATQNYAILRTAWIYSPFGKNFLRTMLRLAETRDSLGVVADQIGNPTSALDIAEGILTVANNLLSSNSPEIRGVFHMTGNGEASWADFAAEIFRLSAKKGGPSAVVDPISTLEYPTPARRPRNSRLDCEKLAKVHGVRLPDWKPSAETVVNRLIVGSSQF
jgi:dTDP-4-dehydrorhamnose reductase